ncbi:hypothetical protein HZH66_002117 [Vespula vulgaris]|uniref:Uncharacterized protein n=1 Tax=Vespula vulgaris TaxID=7454 RepID=A0A834NEY1_VESVU|nr:hypothetical protein HZH66_002117 [Vespula vulgaris]
MSADKIGDRVHGATATEKFEYEPLSAGHPLPSRLFSRKRFILAASEVAGYTVQIAVGYTAWSGRVVKIKMMNARPSLAAALDLVNGSKISIVEVVFKNYGEEHKHVDGFVMGPRRIQRQTTERPLA